MNTQSSLTGIEALRRAQDCMYADVREMLSAVGAEVHPSADTDALVTALKQKFGDNPVYFGFICGAGEALAKAMALVKDFEGDTTFERSLRANAAKAQWNAARFHEMAQEFVGTRNIRCWLRVF